MAKKIMIVDDFYDAPDAVRAHALKSSYANIEKTDYPGFASQLTLSNDALKARFEKLLDCRVVIDPSRFTWGGFRFITEATGARPKIHADAATDWAAMVYLTPEAPSHSGTGFYRHNATGLEGPPTDGQARKLGFADSSDYDDRIIQPDKYDLDRWDLVQTVDPTYNRLILFRGSELYHAPLAGCGLSQEDARLTHIFFFNTVETHVRIQTRSITATETCVVSSTKKSRQTLEDLARTGLQNPDPASVYFIRYDAKDLKRMSLVDLAERAMISGNMGLSIDLEAFGKDKPHNLIITLTEDGRLDEVVPFDLIGCLRQATGHLDLSGLNLEGANLRGANLRDCNLDHSNLRGANLSKADLSHSTLIQTDLSGANLYTASLKSCDLTSADLSRTDLRHADLRDATYTHTALRGADLWNSYLWGVDLSSAFTDGVDFERADDLSKAIAFDRETQAVSA